MRLSTLFSLANLPIPDFDREIDSITAQAQSAGEHSLFLCLRGAKTDGHLFAREASSRGAAVVCETPCGVPDEIIVNDTHEAYALLCAAFYGNPQQSIRLFAVTGTNGKTSVATTVYEILRKSGVSAGLFATTGARWGTKEAALSLTTPQPVDFYRILSEMREDGVTHVVMEASSHALDQKRLFGLQFSVAVFTNLTQDHFDYHENMVQYFCAKKKLFSMAEQAVICVDDPYGKELSESLTIPVKTVSRTGSPADYRIVSCQNDSRGVTFRVIDNAQTEHELHFGIIGDFSAENALCAVLVCTAAGISFEQAAALLQTIDTIPGRCEQIKNRLGITVLCDYAHTPDGIRNVIAAARTVTQKQLILVFGCGGDRDKTKRPLMGEAACDADFVVITSDNPRHEPPGHIMREIIQGMRPDVCYLALRDRAAAIRYALCRAKPGDTVVIAGKGHEKAQDIAGKRFCFDERKLIRHLLRVMEENQHC